MSRKLARETAMKLLFEINYKIDEAEEVINDYFEENRPTDKDKEYILSSVTGALEHINEIDNIIEKYSKGWKINRLAKTDLAILRLSIFELLYSDIPGSVAINEAVELAKKYGSEKSGAFINGILANVIKNEKS